jgi:hypothetical protein
MPNLFSGLPPACILSPVCPSCMINPVLCANYNYICDCCICCCSCRCTELGSIKFPSVVLQWTKVRKVRTSNALTTEQLNAVNKQRSAFIGRQTRGSESSASSSSNSNSNGNSNSNSNDAAMGCQALRLQAAEAHSLEYLAMVRVTMSLDLPSVLHPILILFVAQTHANMLACELFLISSTLCSSCSIRKRDRMRLEPRRTLVVTV